MKNEISKQLEDMTAEELLEVYFKCRELIPKKITTDNFSTVIEALMEKPAGFIVDPKEEPK